MGSVIKTDTWTYSDSTWGDVLTAYNGTSVNSVNGKITSLNGKALAYSYLGLLSSAGSTSFTYDTSGRRLSKTTGGTITNFYYAGDMLVGQKTGSNTLQFFYDVNGDYYGFKYNNVPYNYIKNLQGDVIAIADGSGNILVRYTYDAWGRLISTTDTSSNNIGTINPIRYRGYYFDTETSLYYLNSRYYDPEICRFLSSDSIIDSAAGILGNNIFTYCANNPVIFKDDSGYWVETAWDFFSFGKSLYDVCKNPDDPMAWLGLGLDGLSLLAPGIPALSGSLKVVSYADDVYDACNAVDTVIDTSKTVDNIVDTVKKVPNPYGKLGGPAHRSTINNILSQYPKESVNTEVHIIIENGYKPCRYADFSVTENGHTWYGNVGRQNKNGTPVAREQRALDDIRKMNLDIIFFPYN